MKRILLTLLLLSCPVLAQTSATVTVEDSVTHTIRPLSLGGYNYGNMMRIVGFEEEFSHIVIDSLRFPPGNQGDEITLDNVVLEALHLQWSLLDAPDLMIIANLFGGTAEEAVAAAERMIALELPVVAWTIGNEPDLYATNRGDPSWTPEKYCEHFRVYRDALKTVTPDALITGPAVSGSRPNGENYLRDVLRLCGDVIDVLTWHVYPTDGTRSDEAALATSESVTEEIRRYRSWLTDPEMNPLGYERDILTGITEFGLSWRTNNFRHLEDMPAALWLADALGRMATEGLDMSYYFTLQGLGGHGLIDNSGWVRPTYWVYRMLNDFTGEALETGVDGDPLVTAYTARDGNDLRLLLVNRSLEDAEITLSFDFAVGERLELLTLTDEGFDLEGIYAVSEVAAGDIVTLPARALVVVRAEQSE